MTIQGEKPVGADALPTCSADAEQSESTRQTVGFFEKVLRASTDGIVITDARQDIIVVNEAFCAFFDRRCREMVGANLFVWLGQFDGDAPRRWAELEQRVRREGACRGVEFRLRTQDGVRHLSVNASLLERVADEEEGGIVSIWRDITERKRAEYETQARRMYLEGVLAAAPDAIVTLDARHRVVEWNPGAEKLFGYPPEEVVGRNLDDLITNPDVLEEARGYTRTVLSGEQVGPVEAVRYRQDGSPVDVIVAASPIFVGEELIGLVAVYTDISERKQAEGALRQFSATLEEQVAARTAEIGAEKEKSDAILRSVGDAILMTDQEMRIRYVNPAFTALTGYLPEEVIGRQARSMRVEAGSEQVSQSIRLALAAGQAWEGEVQGLRKDGRTYDAALTITPLRDEAGEVTGYVSSYRDISQRKNLERARSRFMNSVSHELRTPLTNVKLCARFLREGRHPEQAERFLQVIEEQAERLGHLIEDILLMVDLDSGRAVLDWRPVSISRLIEHTVTWHESQAEEARVSVVVKPVPAGLPVVAGDQARLTQALGELVENAIIFTPAGGQVTVEVGTAEEEGRRWVTIAVRDTGPGIPPQEQERIFERLYRGSLAASGHIPGTGLGLSIAQEIMRAHGGRVTVDSNLGQGSTFTLWLLSAPYNVQPQY